MSNAVGWFSELRRTFTGETKMIAHLRALGWQDRRYD